MTKLQKCLMRLMSELDETCIENNIPYALYGRTAGCALKDGKFTTGCYQFQIMMLAGDIITLKERMSEKYKENRGFEDFSVNPDLQYHYVRYVNTKTTVFDKNYPINYIMPGAAITIIPLYTENISKVCEALETGFLYLNGKKVFDEQNKSDSSKRVGRCIRLTKMAVKIFGKKWAAGKIYRSLENEKGKRDEKSLIIRGDDNTVFADLRKKIKAEYLFNTRRIPFEDMELPVSVNSEQFFTFLYGNNWKETAEYPLPTINHMNVIWDNYTSFKEYLSMFQQQGINISEIFAQERALKNYHQNTYETWRKKANRYLLYGKRSVKRIDLYCYYRDKMPQLRKAEEENDIKQIKRLMKRYLKTVEKYKNLGLEFYINDELHHYADIVWKKTKGKGKYGEKILTLTPDIYKKKDIGVFLKQYE